MPHREPEAHAQVGPPSTAGMSSPRADRGHASDTPSASSYAPHSRRLSPLHHEPALSGPEAGLVVDSVASTGSPQQEQRTVRSSTVTLVTINPNSPIKRKPLSSAALPSATRNSASTNSHSLASAANINTSLASRSSRSLSLDSPTPHSPVRTSRPAEDFPPDSIETSPSTYPAAASEAVFSSRNIPDSRPAAPQTETSDGQLRHEAEGLTPESPRYTAAAPDPYPDALFDESDNQSGDESVYSHTSDNDNFELAVPVQKPTLLPPLHVGKLEAAIRVTPTLTTIPQKSPTPLALNKPLPKSPVLSKFGTLFQWGPSPSPSTSVFSSIPSPLSPKYPSAAHDPSVLSAIHQTPGASNTNAAAATNPLGYCESYLHTPPAAASTPTAPVEIEEMEEELKAISAELAASIRREMDLEDLVDRLQTDINNTQTPGKRTSDYFSDSGYSSAKFSDFDHSREEIEKVQRRGEQEKAQIRLELTTKLQDERSKRKVLDTQIQELSQRASRLDTTRLRSSDDSGRLVELEKTCDNLRRRLAEERQVKDNFEDLLSALKGELQIAANERDNLRDEVVPQLRARVEGLEAQAAEHTTLTYESTKMQQELQSLKQENSTLRRSRKDSESGRAATQPFKLHLPPAAAMPTTAKQAESKEALSDRLKDVEAQRDALHRALKSLLDRQEFQNRENEKKIKALEIERERLLEASPQKAGYEKDMANLKNEIAVLRRRAEEAVEQKWQVEVNLRGLKMDIERAEEEIASLRSLLHERDILLPSPLARSSRSLADLMPPVPVTSDSLEKAYRDLQGRYRDSLDRIKKLENVPGSKTDERTRLALERLEQSLSSAVSERDAARREASAFKAQLDDLAVSEAKHLEGERALADELRDSARRVEELAAQVRQQLAANAGLRQRLADTVSRSDADRKANTDRVTSLQDRLRTLEDQLNSAQNASEERVARHEEELAALREAQRHQLRRVNTSPVPGSTRSAPQPDRLSPTPSPLFPKSPRPVPARSVEDEAEITALRAKVTELEKALSDAELEMQGVVAKMSEAQIEVFTVQEEREAAIRETRRLQRILEDEKVKTFEERFRSLTGNVK